MLDLWYKFVRRYWTTVSVTTFLNLNSKNIKDASKKVAHGKKNRKSTKKHLVKLSYIFSSKPAVLNHFSLFRQ